MNLISAHSFTWYFAQHTSHFPILLSILLFLHAIFGSFSKSSFLLCFFSSCHFFYVQKIPCSLFSCFLSSFFSAPLIQGSLLVSFLFCFANYVVLEEITSFLTYLSISNLVLEEVTLFFRRFLMSSFLASLLLSRFHLFFGSFFVFLLLIACSGSPFHFMFIATFHLSPFLVPLLHFFEVYLCFSFSFILDSWFLFSFPILYLVFSFFFKIYLAHYFCTFLFVLFIFISIIFSIILCFIFFTLVICYSVLLLLFLF